MAKVMKTIIIDGDIPFNSPGGFKKEIKVISNGNHKLGMLKIT